MRIALFTNNFFPRISGVSVAVQAIADELSALGHHIFIVAPEYRSRLSRRAKEPSIQRVHSFRFWWQDRLALPLPFFNAGLIKDRLKAFCPDLIHLHHPWLLGAYGLKLAQRFRLPTVLTYHTLYEAYAHYYPGKTSWWKAWAARSALAVCNACNAVIAPSAEVQGLLRNRGVKVPIEVIPTGVAVKDFQRPMSDDERVQLKRSLGIPLHHRVFLNVGRVAKEKNMETLLTAMEHVAEVEESATLLLIGNALDSESWRRRIARKLQRRVVWLSEQPRSALPKFYRMADAFVFPSVDDTQGIVLFEAIAAGLPIIACDSLAARSFIVQSKQSIGWVCENHASDLALTMLKFINHKLPLVVPVKNFQPYSLEQMIRRTLHLYHRLLTAS